MAFKLHRLAAHISAPDTYDPPTLAELEEIYDEIKASREFADMLYQSIEGGGRVVTFQDIDIDTLADLRSPTK